jgi:hypothetical protein
MGARAREDQNEGRGEGKTRGDGKAPVGLFSSGMATKRRSRIEGTTRRCGWAWGLHVYTNTQPLMHSPLSNKRSGFRASLEPRSVCAEEGGAGVGNGRRPDARDGTSTRQQKDGRERA